MESIQKHSSIKRNTKLYNQAKDLISLLVKWAFLILVGFIILYPMIYMAITAIKDRAAFLDAEHQWLPLTMTWDNFKFAYNALDFSRSLKQTFFLQMVSALFEVCICSFIAYGLARFNFKGKKVLQVVLIITLLIPIQMYSLSLSVNYRVLGIFNTPLSYWLPSVFGVGVRSGFMIFIYQQFFIGLPKELEDAAYVDGAGPIKTFFRIALPSSSVVVTTVTVLAVVWFWNERYLAELCFLTENRPLSVMVANFSAILAQLGVAGNAALTPAIVSSACLLYIVIPLVFYLIFQRKFVRSIDRVGITG